MTEQNPFQEQRQQSWMTVDPGVERMIMGFNENRMMVKVRFQKGAVGSLHSHPHIQSTYIAQRKLRSDP